MALRLAGEDIAVQEIMEFLDYGPDLQGSGDLEAATKTITATSKQTTPDYTASITLSAPSDTRLQVKRAGLRLQVTIDSFNLGATTLYWAVEVNGTQRGNGSWGATGNQYAAINLTEGQFNLGAGNSIGIFLWVNGGNAVVSLCQVWMGVGGTGAISSATLFLKLSHSGLFQNSLVIVRLGSGSMGIDIYSPAEYTGYSSLVFPGGEQAGNLWITGLHGLLYQSAGYFLRSGTVPTDLWYLQRYHAILRRVQ